QGNAGWRRLFPRAERVAGGKPAPTFPGPALWPSRAPEGAVVFVGELLVGHGRGLRQGLHEVEALRARRRGEARPLGGARAVGIAGAGEVGPGPDQAV